MATEFSDIREEIGPLPWISGIFRGVLFAMITGILVLLVTYVDFVLAEEAEALMAADDANVLGYLFAWTVFEAHLVPIEGAAGQTVNLLSSYDGSLPDLAYYAVPALALFVAGRIVARANGHADMSNEALGTMGAFVAVGYAPVMVGVALYSQYGGIGPPLLETVLLAGLGFPIVFGFLGGYLAKH